METPEINGYRFVKEDEKLAKLLWGSIEEEYKLKKEREEAGQTGFEVPELPDRDCLAFKMAAENERKRGMKKRRVKDLTTDSARRLLSSVRRSQTSRLLTPKINKID